MSVKKIYFVRHGQTDSNINGSYQSPEEPLNARGLVQADVVSERMKSLTIDRIFASTALRTQQTAAAIRRSTNLAVEISPLFREFDIPTSLHGAQYDADPESKGNRFRREREAFVDDKNWHFEDEENYHDLFMRATEALSFLSALPEENILVVSHGNFLRTCIGYVINGGECTPRDVIRFRKTIETSNTGVTLFECDGTNWKLVTWNDTAHFAE